MSTPCREQQKSSKKWTIAFLCSIINFLQLGVARLSGLFYLSAISRYSTSRSQASFPFLLCYTIRNVSGPAIGVLGRKLGVHLPIICGCVLSSLGIGLCFFAEDITTVTLLWGGVFGLGFGLSTILIPEVLSQHFDKYLSNANGVAFGGECVAGFVLPIFVEFLLEVYGISGCFLITSGLILNSIPAALLLNSLKPLCDDFGCVVENSKSKELSKRRFKDGIPSLEQNMCKDDQKILTRTKIHAIESCNNKYFKSNLEVSGANSKVSSSHDILCRFRATIPSNCQTNCTGARNKNLTKLRNCRALNIDPAIHQKVYDPHIFLDPSCSVSNESQSLIPNVSEHKITAIIIPDTNDRDTQAFHRSIKCSEETFSSASCNTFVSCLRSGCERTSSYSVCPPNSGSSACSYDSHQRYNISEASSCDCNEIPSELTSNLDDAQDSNSSISGLNTNQSPVGDNNTSIFRHFITMFLTPTFLLILITQSCFIFVATTINTIIVDFSRDAGIHLSDEIYVLMSLSISDMAGRFGLGWITDYGYLSGVKFFALCYALMGSLLGLCVVLEGLLVVTIVVVLIGLCIGGLLIVSPGIVSEYIEEDKKTIALASRFFLYAPISLAQAPLIGFFRGELGSYNGVFLILCGVCWTCVILTLLIPAVSRPRKVLVEDNR